MRLIQEAGRKRRARERLFAAVKRLDESPKLLTGARLLRELLPGDSRFGDPLSTAGDEGPQVVGRRLAQLTAERPGLLRETGLSALQVSEAQGRGRGDTELAIVFTDLVQSST